MAPTGKRLARELVTAAFDFHRARPWEVFGRDDILGVRVAGEPDPILVALSGRSSPPGLTLLRGPDAPQQMLVWLGAACEDQDLPYIILSMIPFGSIPPDRRRFLAKAGFSARKEAIAPVIFAETPPRPAREINQTEAALLLPVVRAILSEAARGDPARAPYTPQLTKTPVLTVTGDPRRPEVALAYERLNVGLEFGLAPVYDPPCGLRQMPPGDAHWVVGFDPIPMFVPGLGEPFHLVSIGDVESGQIIVCSSQPGGSLAPAAQSLFRALAGHRDDHLMDVEAPGRITFTSPSLYEAVAGGIAELGIPCCLVPDVPFVDEIRNGFVRFLILEGRDLDGICSAPCPEGAT